MYEFSKTSSHTPSSDYPVMCFKSNNPIISCESVAGRPTSEKCLAYSFSSSSQGISFAIRNQRMFSFNLSPKGKSSGNNGNVLRSLRLYMGKISCEKCKVFEGCVRKTLHFDFQILLQYIIRLKN